MKTVTPYLFFNGNCREAMAFYQKVFGGKLELMTYGDAPKRESSSDNVGCPSGEKDRIMHGALTTDTLMLMASDFPDNSGPKIGDNIHLSFNCESMEEIESIFKALSEQGSVTQPLHDAFWGSRFGMLTDRYSFHWMLSFEKKK